MTRSPKLAVESEQQAKASSWQRAYRWTLEVAEIWATVKWIFVVVGLWLLFVAYGPSMSPAGAKDAVSTAAYGALIASASALVLENLARIGTGTRRTWLTTSVVGLTFVSVVSGFTAFAYLVVTKKVGLLTASVDWFESTQFAQAYFLPGLTAITVSAVGTTVIAGVASLLLLALWAISLVVSLGALGEVCSRKDAKTLTNGYELCSGDEAMLPALKDLYLQSLPYTALPRLGAEAALDMHWQALGLSEKPQAATVILAGTHPVAFMHVTEDKDRLVAETLCVSPVFRNFGLADFLLRAFLDRASQASKPARFAVWRRSPEGRAFLERYGLQPVAAAKNDPELLLYAMAVEGASVDFSASQGYYGDSKAYPI